MKPNPHGHPLTPSPRRFIIHTYWISRVRIRICDNWTLDMCFEAMHLKIRRVIRFTLPKRNFERILLINFIMWPVHPAKGYWLWRIGFDPVVEGQNWHSAPIPALQRHSWHITHYCMMNLNPHDPSAKQNLQHPAVRNLLRQIIWNSKSEKNDDGNNQFCKKWLYSISNPNVSFQISK